MFVYICIVVGYPIIRRRRSHLPLIIRFTALTPPEPCTCPLSQDMDFLRHMSWSFFYFFWCSIIWGDIGDYCLILGELLIITLNFKFIINRSFLSIQILQRHLISIVIRHLNYTFNVCVCDNTYCAVCLWYFWYHVVIALNWLGNKL